MEGIKIPVGRSGFADIRKNGYYYVDKSRLIEELLKTDATQVTLITRPRRFGKTLGMNMLSEFFDVRKDSRAAFAQLSIAENRELCGKWMNQYPVIFLTLRGIDGLEFEGAYAKLAAVISEIYKEHFYLMKSEKLNALDQEMFYRVASKKASREEVENGLTKLSKMLAAHYGKPVILLMDEYDVPLAKASDKGYYREMLDAMKGIMQVVKDNDALKFAVITGCLRIAKESIFTGTNNFVSDTISRTRLDEFFGFTQPEVDQILQDAGLTDHGAEIREWYDGYRFGEFDIYCPWDVMNHVNRLILDPSSKPEDFWANTSDNAVIRSFLNKTDFDVQEKFEMLLAGGEIKTPIAEDITYDIMESSEENLWSLLYLTGYLTRVPVNGKEEGPKGQFLLKIPNVEVRNIFRKSVRAWFTEKSAASDRQGLFDALWNEDEEKLTELISDLLFDTISYYDYRESFYHAFLAGLFSNSGYQVESNYENGLGRSDIVIKDRKNRRAVVIEAKWTDSWEAMEKECGDALRQIEAQQYARKVERTGYKKVGRLGIAFWKKQCLVKSGRA